MIIYGINPVLEALRAGRVRRVRVGTRETGVSKRSSRWRVRRACGSSASMCRRSIATARGGVHQGVVAELDPPRGYSVEELVAAAAPEPPLLVVLDGIEDPHNIGAVLRTVDAAGAMASSVRPGMRRRSTASATKASAGAVATVRVATVVNIARAVEELKDAGSGPSAWRATQPSAYDAVDLTVPTAIVLGAEGTGLRRLVRERCDRLVAIPMRGSVSSLNVSVAAGVTLFEAIRQRRNGGGPWRPHGGND